MWEKNDLGRKRSWPNCVRLILKQLSRFRNFSGWILLRWLIFTQRKPISILRLMSVIRQRIIHREFLGRGTKVAGECWRSCASNPRARRYHNYERSISFSAGDCSGAARLPHHKCAPVCPV